MATMPAAAPDPYAEALSRVEERDSSTNAKLSDKVRNLALGLIGFFWATVSADKDPLRSIAASHLGWLLAMVTLAVLSLLFDLLDSFSDHLLTRALMRQLRLLSESKPDGKAAIAWRNVLNSLGIFSFYAKIAFGCAGCIVLLLLIPRTLAQLKALPGPAASVTTQKLPAGTPAAPAPAHAASSRAAAPARATPPASGSPRPSPTAP